MSMDIPPLGWRVTCARHKERFVRLVRDAGIENEADMELIRRRFMAWLSIETPDLHFETVSTRQCGACLAEARGMDMALLRAKLIELAREL